MTLNLSKKDVCIIIGSLGSHLESVSNLAFYGGEVGSSAKIIEECLLDLYDRLVDFLNCEAIDEANSQDAAAALPKRTASDLDQCEAGDEVSLDQHIQLYKEVF